MTKKDIEERIQKYEGAYLPLDLFEIKDDNDFKILKRDNLIKVVEEENKKKYTLDNLKEVKIPEVSMSYKTDDISLGVFFPISFLYSFPRQKYGEMKSKRLLKNILNDFKIINKDLNFTYNFNEEIRDNSIMTKYSKYNLIDENNLLEYLQEYLKIDSFLEKDVKIQLSHSILDKYNEIEKNKINLKYKPRNTAALIMAGLILPVGIGFTSINDKIQKDESFNLNSNTIVKVKKDSLISGKDLMSKYKESLINPLIPIVDIVTDKDYYKINSLKFEFKHEYKNSYSFNKDKNLNSTNIDYVNIDFKKNNIISPKFEENNVSALKTYILGFEKKFIKN